MKAADLPGVAARSIRSTLACMAALERRGDVIRVILAGWVLGGTLDLSDALIFYWLRARVMPERLLQSIAAGLIGRQAFSGGMKTAALGVAIHYAIALFWVTLFVLIARRARWKVNHAFWVAMLYGILIYAVMNYLVLPLTPLHMQPSRVPMVLLNGVLALMFCIALPVALANRWYATR